VAPYLHSFLIFLFHNPQTWRPCRHGEKGPEAGQSQARGRPEAGMNEEASAGEEDV